jgi:anti-repressor protein
MQNEIEKTLVENKDGQAVTTSLKVAKEFGKRHSDVLRKIEEIINQGGVSKNADTPMFVESTVTNPQNRQKYKMYYMNRDGFTLLAMSFTGKKALKFKIDYMNAFNQMEKTIKEFNQQELDKNKDSYMIDNPVKRAEKWIEEEKERQSLRIENENMKPKAVFADAVSASESTILIGELAKILRQNGIKIGTNRLFAWLRDNGYLIKRKGTDYNTPTQRAMELGLFEIKETVINTSHGSKIQKTTKVTGKGQAYFIKKFSKDFDVTDQLPTNLTKKNKGDK